MRLFYFIGNSDLGRAKKEQEFTEHMLDKLLFRYDDKTTRLEDIKTFNAGLVIK